MKRTYRAVAAVFAALALLVGVSVSPAAALTNHWTPWTTCATLASGYDHDWRIGAYFVGYTSTKWKVDKLEITATGSNVPAFNDIHLDWYDTSTSPDTKKGGIVYLTDTETGAGLDNGVVLQFSDMAGDFVGEETPRLLVRPVRATAPGSWVCTKSLVP